MKVISRIAFCASALLAAAVRVPIAIETLIPVTVTVNRLLIAHANALFVVGGIGAVATDCTISGRNAPYRCCSTKQVK